MGRGLIPTGRDPVRWVVTLFVLNLVLQRVSIPNLSIPLIVVVIMGWMGLGLILGVLQLHRRRLLMWLLAAAVSGLMVIPQMYLIARPFVSFNSWVFWVVVWLPLVVRLSDRSGTAYHRTQVGVAKVGVGASALSLTFLGVQLAGLGYRDWVADILPTSLQVQGYVVSYPIFYGSPIYKSNGWLALEPSFLSFMLGVCLICAIASRRHPMLVTFVFLGLLSTTAGSGLAILAVYLVAVVLTGRAGLLRPYALSGALVAVVFGMTVLGQSVLGRLSEAGSPRSSTALRAIEPYVYLWPRWIADPAAVFVGGGAGSSAQLVEDSGIVGLLVTNIAKVMFDYGLLGGSVLLALVGSTYVRSPDLRIAIALAVSMFTLQSASPPLVVCSFVAVSLWTPLQGGRSTAHAGLTRPLMIKEAHA